jgi:hypothetical protein
VWLVGGVAGEKRGEQGAAVGDGEAVGWRISVKSGSDGEPLL